MPFGLKNAPATIQRVMDIVPVLNDEICVMYLDDIFGLGKSIQEHVQRLRQIFRKLRNANVKTPMDKC